MGIVLDHADWSILPEHCRGGVKRYFENRIEPGSFLAAVLCNDLREACQRADDINQYRLFDYVRFFYMYAPAGSWGSKENYESWLHGKDDI